MSRIRSIHPGIFTDEAWASVSAPARWLAVGLLCEADDNGVFEWKPLQLKMRIFPADNLEIGVLLIELAVAKIVIAYNLGGRNLGAIRNFCKFQKPRKPKTWFATTLEIRQFIGLDDADDAQETADLFATGSELDDVEAMSVPQKSEISPQREDGGWRMEDGEENPIIPFEPPEPEWAEFRKFRKRIGKPLTDHAAKLATKRLSEYVHEGGDPREIINRSIENGWTGLHPQRHPYANGYANGKPTEQTLRGTRPDPSLDLLHAAEREIAARSRNEEDHRETWLTLPPSGSG